MASCILCTSFAPKCTSKTYSTQKEARHHSNIHHSQSRTTTNDDISTSDDMFQRCFPGFSESKPCAVKTELSGRESLFHLCQSLIKERCKRRSPRIDCNNCGQRFERKNMIPRSIVRHLVDHACNHSTVKMYECRHCDKQFGTRSGAMSHLRKNHQIHKSAGHFKDNLNEHISEISSMIESCFSESGRREDLVETVERRKYLLQLCRTLVEERKAKSCIECNKCDFRFKIVDSMAFVLDHSFSHAENDLYQCRMCHRQFKTKTGTKAHLMNIHHIHESITDHIEDKTADSAEDLSALIKDCFSNDKVHADSGNAKIRPRSEALVRSLTDGSKLAVERRLLCYRLIRKRADSDRNVQCRLCPMRISARLRRTAFLSARVMRHALQHLEKPLLRCKLCSKTYNNKLSLECHLKTKHALPLKKNYECFEDQYHNDIWDILKKCYGDETE